MGGVHAYYRVSTQQTLGVAVVINHDFIIVTKSSESTKRAPEQQLASSFDGNPQEEVHSWCTHAHVCTHTDARACTPAGTATHTETNAS